MQYSSRHSAMTMNSRRRCRSDNEVSTMRAQALPLQSWITLNTGNRQPQANASDMKLSDGWAPAEPSSLIEYPAHICDRRAYPSSATHRDRVGTPFFRFMLLPSRRSIAMYGSDQLSSVGPFNLTRPTSGSASNFFSHQFSSSSVRKRAVSDRSYRPV